jgi:hypothetical protein
MLEKGFYKIAQRGGTYIVATFYNPNTKEIINKCVRDYDYEDCSRDDDELYYMEINEDVKKIFMHDRGHILIGDMVKVVKGKTIEHGYIGEVKNIKEYRNKYGRWIADYIYFNDGRKINRKNCILLESEE